MIMSNPKSTSLLDDMFRPPVDRAMRVLDRSFFQKKVSLAAARIFENSQISKCRSELGHDVLRLDRVSVVQPDPGEAAAKAGRRAVLLASGILPNGANHEIHNRCHVLIPSQILLLGRRRCISWSRTRKPRLLRTNWF